MRLLWLLSLLVWTSLILMPAVAPTTLQLGPGLAVTLRWLVPAAAATTVRLQVMDGQGAPLVALVLRVEDVAGQPYDIQTDATGQAIAGPLAGPVCYIRTATLADGHVLQVEPTTARDGLRLGLIPGQERTVRLIADGGLLFLNPEELFPADAPAQPAPDTASLPASAPAVATPPTPPTRPASTAAVPSTAAATIESVVARGASLLRRVLLIVVLASTIVALSGSFVGRRQA